MFTISYTRQALVNHSKNSLILFCSNVLNSFNYDNTNHYLCSHNYDHTMLTHNIVLRSGAVALLKGFQ